MDKILATLSFLVCIAISISIFPEGPIAVFVLAFFSIMALTIIHYQRSTDTLFLQRIFVVALLLRVGFGGLIYYHNLLLFFGGDADGYTNVGWRLYQIWFENFPVNR